MTLTSTFSPRSAWHVASTISAGAAMVATGLLWLALTASTAEAAISVSGTRVIYPLGKREVTIQLHNTAAQPVLVQTWIDDGNAEAGPDEVNAPFMLTPPIFRLDGNKHQTLRLIYTGGALPQDRESVFWLNVLHVPPMGKAAEDKSEIKISMRTRIKIFVRPKSLTETSAHAAEELVWTISADPARKGYLLTAENKSPYFISLGEVEVVDAAAEAKAKNKGANSAGNDADSDAKADTNADTKTDDKAQHPGGMIDPFGKQVFPVTDLKSVSDKTRIRFMPINDHGGSSSVFSVPVIE